MLLIQFISYFLSAIIEIVVAEGVLCSRYPTNTQSSKSPVDDNFAITIAGNPHTYVLNQQYNVTLSAFNGLRFKSFGLTLETEDGGPGYDDSLGHFEIIDNLTTRFSTNCFNMIENTSTNSKKSVTVVWRAPSEPGSGCILMRAMVLQHRDVWYMDDGGLTRRICEEVVDDVDSRKALTRSEGCCACDEARYEIIFEGCWSRNLHPKDFPTNAWTTRFSEIIGSAHSANYRFWEYGALASDGMREFGEHGSTRLLEQEFADNFKNGNIRTIIKARGLAYPNLNGKSIASVRVDPAHSLLSLTSKIEPSPDWIVGISGLELCMTNCTWLDHKTINLYPWDLGTDAGPSYTSADQPQIPPDVIRRLRSDYPNDPRSPFFDAAGAPMKPLATLTVIKQRLYERLCSDDDSNNINIPRECYTHPWTRWSECSADCGEGRQIRTRAYKQPDIAKINSCDNFITRKQETSCVGRKCDPDDPDQADFHREYERKQIMKYIDSDLDSFWPHNSRSDRSSTSYTNKCELDEWESWSSCNNTCGEGYMIRFRRYKNPHFEQECQMRRPQVDLVEYKNCIGRDCSKWPQNPESRDMSTNFYRGAETYNQERENINNFNRENKKEWTPLEESIENENDVTAKLYKDEYNNYYENINKNIYKADRLEIRNLNTIGIQGQTNTTDVEQTEKPHRSQNYYESNISDYPENTNFYKNYYEPHASHWFSDEFKNNVENFCFRPLKLYRCNNKAKTANYWFYNYCLNECMIFAAGTCDKNENKFNSLEACRMVCDNTDRQRQIQFLNQRHNNCQILAT